MVSQPVFPAIVAITHLLFRGDVAWINTRVVACAATFKLWHLDFHTESVFVTASTAASIMGPFFTLPRCSLRMQ